MNKTDVDNFYSEIKTFLDTLSNDYLPLNFAMDFIASDRVNTQLKSEDGESINYLPSKKLSLKVPWPDAAKTGKYNIKELSLFEKYLKWKLNKTYIYKNNMAVLEIIARNNWKRPIYFATSVPTDSYNGLGDYLRLEGFALQLVPYKTDNETYINSNILYDMLMNKGKWGNINKKAVNVDNYVQRTVRILNIRGTFSSLANQLLKEGKKEKAIKVLDRCIDIMPDYNFTYSYDMFDIAEAYYKAGEFEKADKIIKIIYKNSEQYLKYYAGFSDRFKDQIIQDKSQTLAIANQFAELARKYKQTELAEKLSSLVNLYLR